MLRITVRSESETMRLVVEGKLTGACVGELEKTSQAAISNKDKKTILVDLSGVAFVDALGEELLRRMHDQRIRLVATGKMLKSLIEEIESTAK